jgi:hypothetical protein
VNSRSEISARVSQCEVKTLRVPQCVIISDSDRQLRSQPVKMH